MLNLKNLFSFLLLLILFACEKDTEPEYPLVQTGEVSKISPEGAMFHARVITTAEEEIIEHGFLWDGKKNFPIKEAHALIIEGAPNGTTFTSYIPSTLSPEKEYYVVAFIKTRHYISYGSEVSFISKGSGGAELLDFYPKSGNLYDTLTLTGRIFSIEPEETKVYFDTIAATITHYSTDSLKVAIPEGLSKPVNLSVSVNEQASTYSQKFILLPPQITGIYPKKGNIGDKLVITGTNLSSPGSGYYYSRVWVEGEEVWPTEISSDSLQIRIPDKFRDQEELHIEVKNHNGLMDSPEEKFKLLRPHITEFSPLQANLMDTLTIWGTNLSGGSLTTRVFLGDTRIFPFLATEDTLKVVIPSFYNKKMFDVKVINQNRITATAEGKLSLNAPHLTDFHPHLTNLGDTIIIYGKNLSGGAFSSEVFLGNENAPILYQSQDTIKAIVPYELKTENAVLKILNHNRIAATAENQLTLMAPEVTGFSPTEASHQSIITISGSKFDLSPGSLQVFIGEFKAEIKESTPSYIKAALPFLLNTRENTVTVQMNNIKKVAPGKLHIAPLRLADFSPKALTFGQELIIKGENFHPFRWENKVMIGNSEAYVREASISELIVVVPSPQVSTTLPAEVRVSVEVMGQQVVFEDLLLVDTP